MTRLVDQLLAAVTGRDTPSSDDASDGDAPSESSIPVTIEEATEVLATSRRRWIIQHLDEHGSATLAELADHRSREEYGPGYSSTERKREYVSMYQCHLPTLSDHGVVEFNPQRDDHTVRPGPCFEGFVDALEALHTLCMSDAQTATSREEVL